VLLWEKIRVVEKLFSSPNTASDAFQRPSKEFSVRDPGFFPMPPASSLEASFTLPDDVSAVPIQPSSGPEPRLGPVSKLPRGARVQPCGNGFNSNTLKVFYEGQFYYIFAKELAAAS
jgi:hypothetical protein